MHGKVSVLEILLKNQKKNNTSPKLITEKDKIVFVFNTKDRVDLSLKTLPTIDEKGFDIIWDDGSDTKEGRELPQNYHFKNANLIEYNLDVRGGPDKAIQFGLKRMIELGYDYCGLIENDILFEKEWFGKIIDTFNAAAKDGLVVGAVSVRTYENRVAEYRDEYTINWAEGAGMVLFSKQAAQIILDNYPKLFNFGRALCLYYANLLSIDLRGESEPARYFIGKPISADFSYDMFLYKNGLASIGSIPSMVRDLGIDIRERELVHVENKKYIGIPHKKANYLTRIWLFLNVLLLTIFWAIWKMFSKIKQIKKIEDYIEKTTRNILRKKRGLKIL